MSSSKPLRALVLTGDGINCERETAHALTVASFKTDVVHLNDLIAAHRTDTWLKEQYSVLALPGGFSFGDDLTSGKVLALKIEKKLGWDLPGYASSGRMVIGICNGFQALVRLGVFGKDVSITNNAEGKFINTWSGLELGEAKSPWLLGLVGRVGLGESFELPIRHGEGRIVPRDETVLARLNREGRIALRYTSDLNGSADRIAGLLDSTGRIFGLMPHPEAAIRRSQYPRWSGLLPDGPGVGLTFFENAAKELRR